MSTKIQKYSEKTSPPGNDNSLLVHTLGITWQQPTVKGPTILQKKARAKYRTREHILPLIDLDGPFTNKYWDTYHCCDEMKQEGQYITGNHCGNRWCLVCSRIMTAKLIIGYKDILNSFQNPMFVTLTVPNVTEDILLITVSKMVQTFNKINHLFRHERPYRIIGIRKIEIEPSVHPGEYHPHFHIILEGRCVAEALVREWLIRFPEADKRGQNVTPCTPGFLAEFFKYVTKPAVKSKHTAYQLDVIYRALYKKRVFQPIGINKAIVKEEIDNIISQKIPEFKEMLFTYQTWNWNHEAKDWINLSGQRLSRYRQIKDLSKEDPKKVTIKQSRDTKII